MVHEFPEAVLPRRCLNRANNERLNHFGEETHNLVAAVLEKVESRFGFDLSYVVGLRYLCSSLPSLTSDLSIGLPTLLRILQLVRAASAPIASFATEGLERVAFCGSGSPW